MAWYASHGGEMPVMGFTPDGEYPLINGEKGILNGTYTRTLHQTGDYILTRFEGGEASNISPAYAVAEVKCPAEAASKIAAEKVTVTPIDGGIRVEAEGVAVHGSTPGVWRKRDRTARHGARAAAVHGRDRRVPRVRL